MSAHAELHGPLPSLGTKVTFDGVEGRVRGHVLGRHADYSRLVVVELKRGFYGHTDANTGEKLAYVGRGNIYFSAITVHASNLKDSQGRRKWARPEELGDG